MVHPHPKAVGAEADLARLGSAFREQLLAAFDALADTVTGLSTAELNRTLGPDTSSIAMLVHHSIETARSILLDVEGHPVPRHREASFAVASASEADLLGMLADWRVEVDALLDSALVVDLGRPIARFREAPAAWWLLQSLVHTQEHGAQAALTRQLITQRAGEGLSFPTEDDRPTGRRREDDGRGE